MRKLHLCFTPLRFNNLTKLEDLLFKLAERDIEIKKLDISLAITPITESLIESIIGLKRLETLNMTDGYSYLNDELLSKLATKGTIKELHLNDCNTVTLAGLTHFIENSPKIRVLKITECNQITNKFYYRAVAILKEKKRQHCLTVFALETQMKENGFNRDVIVESLPWIEVKFLKPFVYSEVIDDGDDADNEDDDDDNDDSD